jgi:hypothetical protein
LLAWQFTTTEDAVGNETGEVKRKWGMNTQRMARARPLVPNPCHSAPRLVKFWSLAFFFDFTLQHRDHATDSIGEILPALLPQPLWLFFVYLIENWTQPTS